MFFKNYKACNSLIGLLILSALNMSYVFATSVTLDESERFGDTRRGAIPYAFSTDSLGTVLGIGGFVSGINQPQSRLVGTAFVSDNDSWLAAVSLGNYRFDALDRWFFSLYAQSSHFTDQRFYATVDNRSADRAGSNDSSKDDFITGVSNDTHLEFTVRYPLSIGSAKDDPLTTYRTRRGLLISAPLGGEEWNPLTSGKTILGGQYFFRHRDLQQIAQEDLLSVNTNGLSFWLDYNNTDFLPNANSGSRQKITLTRDFGWLKSSNSWTNLELDASEYFNLGTSDWFRHQVLALDFWTSYTPDWELDRATGAVDHRPPPEFAAYLGDV